MNKQITKITEKVVRDLKKEFNDDLEGILVSGSAAKGTMCKNSDIDIVAIITVSKTQRRTFYVDSFEVEMLIGPLFQFEKEFSNYDCPDKISIFATGIILFDKKGMMKKLKKKAQTIWNRPRPTPNIRKYPTPQKYRHIPFDKLKDVEDVIGLDEEAAMYMIYDTLRAALDVFYKLEKRWTVKEKYLLQDLKKASPEIEKQVRKILSSKTSTRKKYEVLSDLVHKVLQPIGGPLGEWRSPWIPVEKEE